MFDYTYTSEWTWFSGKTLDCRPSVLESPAQQLKLLT